MRRLALLLVPLALGCQPGGSGEGNDEAGDGLAESEWVGEYAAAMCQLAQVECDCSDPLAPSLDECIDFYNQVLGMSGNEAEAAGLVYDGTCAAEAVASLEQFGCGTWSDPPVGDCSTCRTLSGIYHGDVVAGAACVIYGGGSDCASGLHCLYGVCVDPCDDGWVAPSLGEGETCSDADSILLGQCDAGLRCDFTSDTCVPVPAIGEACPDGYCEPGAHCSVADPMMPICVESPADGEPCPDGVCAVYGSVCKQDPAICVAEAQVCG